MFGSWEFFFLQQFAYFSHKWYANYENQLYPLFPKPKRNGDIFLLVLFLLIWSIWEFVLESIATRLISLFSNLWWETNEDCLGCLTRLSKMFTDEYSQGKIWLETKKISREKFKNGFWKFHALLRFSWQSQENQVSCCLLGYVVETRYAIEVKIYCIGRIFCRSRICCRDRICCRG